MILTLYEKKSRSQTISSVFCKFFLKILKKLLQGYMDRRIESYIQKLGAGAAQSLETGILQTIQRAIRVQIKPDIGKRSFMRNEPPNHKAAR